MSAGAGQDLGSCGSGGVVVGRLRTRREGGRRREPQPFQEDEDDGFPVPFLPHVPTSPPPGG